jgi:hypothetical protein
MPSPLCWLNASSNLAGPVYPVAIQSEQSRALTEITDFDRLVRLIERLPAVSTWQELLQTP